MRRSLVVVSVLLLVGAPVAALLASGLGPQETLLAASAAFLAGVDAVGWVFVPQAFLAVAVLGAALQRGLQGVAGELLGITALLHAAH